MGAFPLPVELVRFGAGTTMRLIAQLLERHDVAGRDMHTRQGKDGHKGPRSYSVSGRLKNPGVVLAPAQTNTFRSRAA